LYWLRWILMTSRASFDVFPAQRADVAEAQAGEAQEGHQGIVLGRVGPQGRQDA
jgi:hypothetical protein